MSGTSLDGIDLCLVNFKRVNKAWSFEILKAETIPYTKEWLYELKKAESCFGNKLIQLDFEYGKLLGETAVHFLEKHSIEADSIASHGHTIFHQIENGLTFQLGHGAALAAASNLLSISDFRSLDVALGGQGAPLVPYGDQELFSEFDCCINLGGIANLSFEKKGTRLAFDICACNMILNHLMREHFNKKFDQNGAISRQGNFNEFLFNQLNKLDYFQIDGPKSLGKEWIFQKIIPLFEKSNISIQDQLFTFSKHCAFQIGEVLRINKIRSNILLTGGGSKNKFLLELIRQEGFEITLPKEQTIDFKEALIFAFLGLKRILKENNTLKSVTGASRNSCGGSVYLP
ncbi:MAG: anhydro-N-acetylmuramic acid kinase [Flavobacteriales bacterium]|nr:anhydro-N-acetylmuramic acid kinase [Flavobacteriales bacterium]